MTILTIVTLILLSLFDATNSASACYACNPCGTTWNPSVTTIIQTTSTTDYCRKTVTGTLVVKDSTSSCTPISIPNNGVYCCQDNYCNAAMSYSLKMVHLGLIMIILRTMIY